MLQGEDLSLTGVVGVDAPLRKDWVIFDMPGLGEDTERAELQIFATEIGVVGSGGWAGLIISFLNISSSSFLTLSSEVETTDSLLLYSDLLSFSSSSSVCSSLPRSDSFALFFSSSRLDKFSVFGSPVFSYSSMFKTVEGGLLKL